MPEIRFFIKAQSPDWPAQEKHKEIADSLVKLWSEIGENISTFSLHTKIGDIEITIDWEPIVNFVKQYHNDKYIYGAMVAKPLNGWGGSLNAVCRSLVDINENRARRTVCHYLDNYFNYLFLIFNISSPGSISFYNWEINFGGERIWFNLDGSQFFSAWESAIDNGWPILTNIPLLKSLTWLEKLDIGTNQIARTPIERTLFALLHIANSKALTPTDLIWLTHCLESLFDTPSNGITRVLRDRILLVLGNSLVKQKHIRKKIQNFYDFRSKFVHGKFDIHSPVNNELFDEELNSYRDRLYESTSFAMSIVLGTIQRMIDKGWTKIKFIETFCGDGNGV